MARKKQKAPMKENKLYVLPSLNDEMRNFVKNFKIDMMEHIISSIRFAIENKMPIIEVFQFKDSPFVVTISEKEFETNLNFIHQFFKENEIFDLMGKVESLQKLIKSKTNETQKSETNDDS